MITSLAPSQIDAYEEDGYLLLPGFLDDGELERWRRAVDDGVARLVGNADPEIKLFDNQNRDDYYRDVFIQCVNMWKGSGQVRELVLDERLGRLAAELVSASGMRLYHDHALIKKPWANPTNWHLDNPSDPYFSHQSTMLWIALDDATLQNGCLYFLPESHKSSRFERVPALSETRIDALFEHYPEWRGIEPVAVEARAGRRGLHQRPDRPRRGPQHEPPAAAGLRHPLHAGRSDLQRAAERPSRRRLLPPRDRRRHRRRRAPAAALVPELKRCAETRFSRSCGRTGRSWGRCSDWDHPTSPS